MGNKAFYRMILGIAGAFQVRDRILYVEIGEMGEEAGLRWVQIWVCRGYNEEHMEQEKDKDPFGSPQATEIE